jgi:SANT/Myb-like domain of DAMP1/DNA methyltransferase 1-associated protein 1 (DMAP1)
MLTGGVTPSSLMPVVPVSALQLKPTQKRAWVRKQFRNGARSDNLLLHHWTRVGEPVGAYPFEKFNKPIRMIKYSNEEYAAVIDALEPLGPTKPHVPNPALSPLPLLTPSAAGLPGTGPTMRRLETVHADLSSNRSVYAVDTTLKTTPAVDALRSELDQNSAASQPQRSQPRRASDHGIAAPPGMNLLVTGDMRASPRNVAGSPLAPSSSPTGSLIGQNQRQTRRENNRAPSDSDLVGTVDSVIPSGERITAAPEPKTSASGASTLAKKAIYFVPPQKLWTREETDALFELCSQFDLRFPVIHDRWPSKFATRSVDELKDRYYAVAKAVLEYRTKVDKAALTKMPIALQKHAQAISMNPFDYEYECIRKNQLERQYKRSKEELREEEETVRNARRIEANQKRLKKERERLAKLLTPAGDILMTAPDGTRVVDAKIAAAAIALSQPQKVFPHRKINSGAHARSSQIYTPVTQSSRLAKRVDQVLEELKVGTRPTPTSYVVDNFDLLRMDILSYLELHRTVLRKEEETYNLRVRLAKLKGEQPPPPPDSMTSTQKRRKADEALDTAAPVPLFSS